MNQRLLLHVLLVLRLARRHRVHLLRGWPGALDHVGCVARRRRRVHRLRGWRRGLDHVGGVARRRRGLLLVLLVLQRGCLQPWLRLRAWVWVWLGVWVGL